MPPILVEALGAIIRHGFTTVGTLLVAKGIWTQEAAGTYAAAFAMFAIGIGGSLWQKYKGRIKFLVALSAPTGATEEDVDKLLATPNIEKPSVRTPKNVPPKPPVRATL